MITNAWVLQPEFIPGEDKHRDAEVSHLSDTLRPIATNEGHPTPSFLTGPSGAGKTCIARHTDETHDLVGAYDQLIGKETCDPFADSGEAVDAFENDEWKSLLLHNLADTQRTRELAVLASKYVPKSDFRMKNLTPPSR